MNIRERRSVQRRSWLGYLVLAAVPLVGIMLLSGRLSLVFVALVAGLLCAVFAAGFVLLYADVRARAKDRRLAAAGELR